MNNNNLKIGIGILNWNGVDATLNLMKDLRAQKDVSMEILIIDNGSRNKEDVEVLKKNVKEENLLINDSNVGVAKGFNQEIKYLLDKNCHYICLLNNDTEIKDVYLFKKLLNDFQKLGDKAILTPVILYSDDHSSWYNRGFYRDILGLQVPAVRPGLLNKLIVFLLSGEWPTKAYFDSLKGVKSAGEFISGCGLTFHKNAIRDIGFFDEKYFAYCEDLDFSQRALKKGYGLFVDYDAVLYHRRSLTSAHKNSHRNSRLHIYMWSRNFMMFSKKNLSLPKFILFLLFRPIVGAYWFIRSADRLKFPIDFIRGNIDGLTGRLRKDIYFS